MSIDLALTQNDLVAIVGLVDLIKIVAEYCFIWISVAFMPYI